MQEANQPFCIRNSKGKFRGSEFGYLPPLELEEQPEICKKSDKEKIEQTLRFIEIERSKMRKTIYNTLQEIHQKYVEKTKEK